MKDLFDLMELISGVMDAHSNQANEPGIALSVSRSGREVRRWDGETPYFIHPIWCAMTLLTEETLPRDIRVIGAQVLLYHDVLENTSGELSDELDDKAREIISEMLYEDSVHEMREIWSKSKLAILFKLYDKVSNLLDSSWMIKERGEEYYRIRLGYVLSLVAFVEKEFGILNIVIMARAVVEKKRLEMKTIKKKGGCDEL